MSGDLGNSYNIDIWGLLIALGMVAVAAIISELMHMGIGKTLMWSSCRALVQLCAMGFIIGYVIRSNNVWMVFSLMAVMLVAAVQIVMSRARGIPKGLAGPIFLSLVITMLLMLSILVVIHELGHYLAARFFKVKVNRKRKKHYHSPLGMLSC